MHVPSLERRTEDNYIFRGKYRGLINRMVNSSVKYLIVTTFYFWDKYDFYKTHI